MNYNFKNACIIAPLDPGQPDLDTHLYILKALLQSVFESVTLCHDFNGCEPQNFQCFWIIAHSQKHLGLRLPKMDKNTLVIWDECILTHNYFPFAQFNMPEILSWLWSSLFMSFYHRSVRHSANIIVIGSKRESVVYQQKFNQEVYFLPPVINLPVRPNDDLLTQNSLRKKILFWADFSNSADVRSWGWLVEEVIPRLKAAFGKDFPGILVMGSSYQEDDYPPIQSDMEFIFEPTELLKTIEILKQTRVTLFPSKPKKKCSSRRLLYSLAYGSAVVTTGYNAKSVSLIPNHDILIAESADNFSNHIIRIFRDPELFLTLQKNSYHSLGQRHSKEAALESIKNLFELKKKSLKI